MFSLGAGLPARGAQRGGCDTLRGRRRKHGDRTGQVEGIFEALRLILVRQATRPGLYAPDDIG